LPEATFKVMKEGKPRRHDRLRPDRRQEGGAVRRTGRVHADLLGAAPAGLQGEGGEEFRAKGVDTIACVSVNDVFVMDAWGKDQQVGEDVVMLADGNGAFAKAVGLEMDGKGFGMGSRSQRYSMIVEDGVVKQLNVEAPGKFKVSAADYMLGQL
jgi:hypothetical protein